MGKTRSKRTQKNNQKAIPTNGWDALIAFFNMFYKLTSSGNLLGAIVLLFFGIIFYLAYKLPPENINTYILMVFRFLGSEKYYLLPFCFTLSFSLYANYRQKKVYRGEIIRLANHRKELVHGLENGSFKPLEKHNTSNFDFETD